MMYTYECPVCNTEIEAERFGDAIVVCPYCNRTFRTVHECYYNDEDDWCSDTLEPADDQPERGTT